MVDDIETGIDRDSNDSDERRALLDALARVERMLAGLVVLASLDAICTERRDHWSGIVSNDGGPTLKAIIDNASCALTRLDARIEKVSKRFGL